ncbi:MAG TPA: hypothetical protein VMX75_09915, partial [Spirochaetia bacterium]|nr:hypothetical protein [Spirochaetia bacterium]
MDLTQIERCWIKTWRRFAGFNKMFKDIFYFPRVSNNGQYLHRRLALFVAKLAGLYNNSGRYLAPALQFSAVLEEMSRFSDLRLAVPDYFYHLGSPATAEKHNRGGRIIGFSQAL